MSELDEALRILKEVRAAIIGCCDPSGSDEDGYRIRHGELTGWFDQLETAGLHILRDSLATRRSDALQTLADIDRDLIDDRKSAKQPAILAREITAVDEFLADGQEDNGYRAFAMMRHMWPRLRELALASVAEDLDKLPGSEPDYVLPGHDETVSNLEALTVRGRQ